MNCRTTLRRNGRFIKTAFFVALAALWGLSQAAVAEGEVLKTGQTNSPSASAEQATPASSTPSASQPATNPFASQALDGGAKQCAAAYASLGNALVGGAQFTLQTQMSKGDPDRHGIQGTVGIIYQSSSDASYSGPAAGVVMAVPTGATCEGNMVRVVPFTQDCTKAASYLPPGSTWLPSLSGLQTAALAAGGQAVFLPSGNGCVVISVLRSAG